MKVHNSKIRRTSIQFLIFLGTKLLERHATRFRYQLPITMKIGEAFGWFEARKESLNISAYSLSQVSLEQIFNYFAAQQDEEKGAVMRG